MQAARTNHERRAWATTCSSRRGVGSPRAGRRRGSATRRCRRRGRDRAVAELEDAMRRPLPDLQPGAFEAYERQLAEYFSSERASCDVELDLDGASPFFQPGLGCVPVDPAGRDALVRVAGGIRRQRAGGAGSGSGDGAQPRSHRRAVPPGHREGRRTPRVRRRGPSAEGAPAEPRSRAEGIGERPLLGPPPRGGGSRRSGRRGRWLLYQQGILSRRRASPAGHRSGPDRCPWRRWASRAGNAAPGSHISRSTLSLPW